MFNLLKPWYLYRPSQILRRLRCTLAAPQSQSTIQLPWGCPITVDARKTIGRSLIRNGVYELATSEVLWRLIRPGDQVLDIGANVGYMTAIMCRRVGPNGRVIAFEPHPVLFRQLEENVSGFCASQGYTNIEIHPNAVSDKAGPVSLVCPSDFDQNDGIARVDDAGVNGDAIIKVASVRLDDFISKGIQIAVAKIDVEGHEFSVLRGASHLIHSGGVKHIVFEEHEGAKSAVCSFLKECGFTLLQFGWSLRRLIIAPVTKERLARTYEAPNFIATKDPNEVMERCQPSGWQVLRG